MLSSNQATSYVFMASGVDTHTCTHTRPHESDFKKPGVCCPVAGLIKKNEEVAYVKKSDLYN